MAYVIGNKLGRMDSSTTLDKLIEELIYSIPRDDAFKFLRGLEDAYAEIGLKKNDVGYIEKAAKIAVKNFDLDVNLVGDSEIEGRIKKYEEKLTEQGFYWRAAIVAALMPWSDEAWFRLKGYAAKDSDVYNVMWKDKKVSDKLTKDEKDFIDFIRNLDKRRNLDTSKPSL